MIGPLSYIGGKRRIAPQIVALIPPHVTYVEPFAGGAQVFFHKPRSCVEVLNDLDGEIVNFLRVCQRHPEELARVLSFQPASREIFTTYQQPGSALTDVERAARFFYLQKNTWGGKRRHRNFHYAVSKPLNYNPPSFVNRFADAAQRLARVQLENRPYQKILNRFDRPTSFFYLDPPYVGVDLYQHHFTDAQFEELAGLLTNLRGKFLLSLNDCPKSRNWFAAFHCREVSLTYTAIRKPRPFNELLFANYPLVPTADLNTRPLSEGVRHPHDPRRPSRPIPQLADEIVDHDGAERIAPRD